MYLLACNITQFLKLITMDRANHFMCYLNNESLSYCELLSLLRLIGSGIDPPFIRGYFAK